MLISLYKRTGTIIALLLLIVTSLEAQYDVIGTSPANAGETYQYRVMPIPGGAPVSWTVTNGTTSNITAFTVDVTWNCGPASGTVTAARAGLTITPMTVTINSNPTLQGGLINPTSQSINAGVTPALLTCTAPTGGSCSAGAYTYTWWYSATAGGNGLYTQVSGATSATFQPPSTLTGPYNYYKRRTARGAATAFSTISQIVVSPALVPGTISPAPQSINYNTTPLSLTVSAATGGNGTYTYQWQSSATGSNPWTNVGSPGSTYSPGNLTATTYYRVAVTSNGQTLYSATATITVYPQLAVGGITPASITVNYNNSPGALVCSTPTGGNGTYQYEWLYSNDNTAFFPVPAGEGTGSATQTYTPPGLVQTKYYKVNVTSNGFTVTSGLCVVTVNNPYGVAAPTNITGNANTNMNWILSKGFDAAGLVISEAKAFYGIEGQMLQTQTKLKYRRDPATVYTHVFATQPLRDVYGREAANVLPAPIDYSEFSYKADFVTNAGGTAYDYKNFDRYKPTTTETDKTNTPDPLGGQTTKGTVGWYYGVNNTWEPYMPTSNYPYTRQTFYKDGTNNIKKISESGESFKMGSGHESAGYITPVVNELAHYIQVRNKYFTVAEAGALPASMQNQAIQVVSRNKDGREAVVIQDAGGRTLMVARPGADLAVTNSVSIGGPSDPGEAIYYFKLFAGVTVTITGGSYSLYNMETELSIAFTSGSVLAAGYYKLENTGSTAITLGYSNSYTDVSYSFYNQLGQLVATIAPEGVKKLFGTGINNYATRASVPFISISEYNVKGQLVNTTGVDAGKGEIVYRLDGKIRFSQNADQKLTGRYSYTNYDPYGRPIENGEYQPDGSGIAFTADMSVASPLKNILENTSATGGLTTGTKRDVVMTQYDLADNSHGQAGYTQDEFTLAGAVSYTRKYSTVVNNAPSSTNLIAASWFNYDVEDKLVWMIQLLPNAAGGFIYKTTDYTYDNMDRLVKKVFQKNTAAETFVHYLEYDASTHQLASVFTNTVDNSGTKVLRAKYIYYLHGTLKRIELGTNLQGIDYTYTLQGALKAINNSDKTKDPGADGANGFGLDAYGVVLDYFNGDYLNSKVGVQPIKAVNTAAITTDSYSGNIKAMTWYSIKPAILPPGSDNPITYVYKYDNKYQFTESVWGTGLNFGTTPVNFTTTNFNKETILEPNTTIPAYDANGNIKYLQRTNSSGGDDSKFIYTYVPNTNKLQSVVDNKTGSNVTHANYTYNTLGQLTFEDTGDPAKKKYIKYDVNGKVVLIARDAAFTQKVVEFVYNESGQRTIKKSYNSSYQLIQVTYYAGDVVYTQAVSGTFGSVTPQEYAVAGGPAGRLGLYFKQTNIYTYELTDHLGSPRAIVAQNGATYEVRAYTDYYPFGMVIPGVSTDYRYGYQGEFAEKDPETDWNAFELRMYDSKIARWFSQDPAAQFFSPYLGMGNNPGNGVDPDGGLFGRQRAWLWSMFHGGWGRISKSKDGNYWYGRGGNSYVEFVINPESDSGIEIVAKPHFKKFLVSGVILQASFTKEWGSVGGRVNVGKFFRIGGYGYLFKAKLTGDLGSLGDAKVDLSGPSIGYEFQLKGVGSSQVDITAASVSLSTQSPNIGVKIVDVDWTFSNPKNSTGGGITGFQWDSKDGVKTNQLKAASATHKLSGRTSVTISPGDSQYFVEGKIVKVGLKVGYDTKRWDLVHSFWDL